MRPNVLPQAAHVVIVVGTGSIGMRHLSVLRDRVGIPAVGIPVRPERCAALEAQGYATLPDLDAVGRLAPVRSVVATDTRRHAHDTIRLLEYGDVLVEKPLACSATDVGAIVRRERQTGHRVTVAYCFRHDPGVQAFRQRLPAIGRVHSVHIECQSYLPDWRPDRDYRASYSARSADGGVIRDLSHELDYGVWLFGRPEAVWCASRNTGRLGIESPELADLFWSVPDGPRVAVSLDYLSRPTRRRMTAAGELGTLTWDAVAGTVALDVVGAPTHVIVARAKDRNEIFAAQAQAFLNGDHSIAATLDDGSFIVALIDAAEASAGESRAARIQPVDVS